MADQAAIRISPARRDDAADLARVHEEAWRVAYQGVIPHLSLQRIIARRGPAYWEAHWDGVLALRFDGAAQGYCAMGPSRIDRVCGEIYELYLAPAFQGGGLGERLFAAARRELQQQGYRKLVVWALRDNGVACEFYTRRGGRPVFSACERFGAARLDKIGFFWPQLQ
ncbi:MAG: GNAT family N-acetyltransferase [Hyphomicrobiales bacterium]|nr:GNAT family N-acetyltransferase [Hyphomicrobiales bacterium]